MAKLRAEDALARQSNPLGRDFSEALARGIEIMTVFGPEARALTMGDVARRVGLPRATVRRALLTLVQLGYAEEDGRLFRLTSRVLHLASAYLGSSVANSILQPCCESLAAEYGETFSVAVLDGEDAVMIAYATPQRMYMDRAGVGLRIPAYCSAVGRVLLAGRSEAEREEFLERLQPKPVTSRTVTSKATLRRILAQAEQDGFAFAEEEAEVGFRSLAVPLRRLGGQVAFALNTGMPVERSSIAAMRTRYLPRLIAEAESLQKQLI
jgi:IclR family transcriptional regulator, pca regulon regulatory protein